MCDDGMAAAADSLYQDNMELLDQVQDLENMLLNAFQLVKNGKKIPYLKYDEFKERMKNRQYHVR